MNARVKAFVGVVVALLCFVVGVAEVATGHPWLALVMAVCVMVNLHIARRWWRT